MTEVEFVLAIAIGMAIWAYFVKKWMDNNIK